MSYRAIPGIAIPGNAIPGNATLPAAAPETPPVVLQVIPGRVTRLEIFQPRPRTPDILVRPQEQRNSDAYDSGKSYGGGSSSTGGDGGYVPDPGGGTGGGGTVSTAGNPTCLPVTETVLAFSQSGSDYISPNGSSPDRVYFDGLLAGTTMYTLGVDGTITPNETLLAGTDVRGGFRETVP